MSTVRDLIKGSMRLIGAIASGETPSADEQADALLSANELLESLSLEGLLIHSKVREEFSLTAGTQSYTIGSSGTFNTSRPLKIEAATIEDQSGDDLEIPLRIINLKQWSEIGVKSTQSTIPMYLYIEDTYPLMTLNLWPVPSSANKLVLYSQKQLTAFASANTDVSLPPGYYRMLKYGLALELGPEYGKPATAEIMNAYIEAKESVKRSNIRPHYLSTDEAVRSPRGFDYRTGE